MKKGLRISGIIIVGIFALFGFLFITGYTSMRLGLTKTAGKIDTQTENFVKTEIEEKKQYTTFPLAHTPEWIAFRIAVAKDNETLLRIQKDTGIEPRLLVALLVPEQMRLYLTNRPIFKEVFEPLKVLGNQSQFSWGILGIKDETARQVERNLKERNSNFYPGDDIAHLLDFKTRAPDQERFNRIIDEQNHYFGYLYAAIYIRELSAQWAKAGAPLGNRIDVLATLWNLGFEKSKPNNEPKSGGSTMDINGLTWTFGSLAQNFYDSDELVELFPKQ